MKTLVGAFPPDPEVWLIQVTAFDQLVEVAEMVRAGVVVAIAIKDPDLRHRAVDFAAGLMAANARPVERVAHGVYLLSVPPINLSPATRRALVPRDDQ